MALHAISVFNKVYKWSPGKKMHFKSIIKSASKKWKKDKWLDLPY